MSETTISEIEDIELKDIEDKLILIRENMKEMNDLVVTSLKKIEENIEEIVNVLKVKAIKNEGSKFKPSILFDLPDHLRLTIRMLLEIGMGTAEDVSKKTNRSRSLESAYLNNLTTMGYVEKERKGQMVYYKVKFDSKKVKVE